MPDTPPSSEPSGPPPPSEGDKGETHPPRRQDQIVFAEEEGSPQAFVEEARQEGA